MSASHEDVQTSPRVLLIASIVLLVTDALDTPVYPYFMPEILASNLGGTATLIGDSHNILIGSVTSLSSNQFVFNLAPSPQSAC